MAKPKRKPRQYMNCLVCEIKLEPRRKCFCRQCAFAVRAVQAIAMRARKSLNLPPASTLKCVDCRKPALHYDHRYYSKPLDIEPVCQSCNSKRGPALDIKRMVKRLNHFT